MLKMSRKFKKLTANQQTVMIAKYCQRKEVKKMERLVRDKVPGMGDINMVVQAMEEPQRTEAIQRLWGTLWPSSFVQSLRGGAELTIKMENFSGMEG